MSMHCHYVNRFTGAILNVAYAHNYLFCCSEGDTEVILAGDRVSAGVFYGRGTAKGGRVGVGV